MATTSSMQAVLGLAEALNAVRAVEELAAVVAELARDVLGADFAAVAVLEADGKHLTYLDLAAHVADQETVRRWQRMPVTQPSPPVQAVRTASAVIFQRLADAVAAHPQVGQDLIGTGFETIANVPLLSGGSVLGLLGVAWEAQEQCSPSRAQLAQALAALTAQVLARLRLVDQRTRDAERMAALVNVAQAMGEAETESEVLQVLSTHAIGALGAQGTGLCLPNDDRATMRLLTSSFFEQPLRAHPDTLPADAALPIVHAAVRGTSYFLPDRAAAIALSPQTKILYARERTEASAEVPLRVGGELLGSLSLAFADAVSWRAEERALIEALAAMTAQALQRLHARRTEREAAEQVFARAQELQDLNRQLQLAKDELAVRALHDTLTGLVLRPVLLGQLTRALARLARHRGDVALLFVDLDGLKQVNDSYGHAAGDALIRCCAERLQQGLRPSDIVARFGGDEFVVLLDELDEGGGPAQARIVAERLLETLASPCTVGPGVLARPSASIGIATTGSSSAPAPIAASGTGSMRGALVLPPDRRGYADADAVAGTDPDTLGDANAHAWVSAHELLWRADAAMYEAKRSGRGRFCSFDGAAHRTLSERRRLEADLRDAVPARRLRLHYQPIIDLRSGATHAVEALLRWQHPDGRLRAAAEFIDAAEQAGLLPELGRWVIGEACRQLAAWDAILGARAPQRMFLNLSAGELAQPHLHQHLAVTASTIGVDPRRLVLEVTETGLLDTGRTAKTIEALQHLGCQLAIDDFGTGYSSLSRLVHLPASVLKIDRSFLRDLHSDHRSVAVIAAVLTLAHNLRKIVVAEGVEDAASLAVLQDLGCSYAQGYHLARPQPPDELDRHLGGFLTEHPAAPPI